MSVGRRFGGAEEDERVVSVGEGPGAQEGMENYGNGVGVGDPRDLWVL